MVLTGQKLIEWLGDGLALFMALILAAVRGVMI